MSDQQALRDILRPIGKAVVPADEQRKLAAMGNAFTPDGADLRAEVLARAGVVIPLHWFLSGSVSTGTNVAAELEVPTRSRLIRLIARCKGAPSSGTCSVRLTQNGGEVDTVSIPAGEFRNASPLNLTVDPGTVLRIDVLTANGATSLTVEVLLVPASI